MMPEKMMSGGETGANVAGELTAKAFGVAASGWMRKGFLTDDGCHPTPLSILRCSFTSQDLACFSPMLFRSC
jgi:hypothetical protein